MEVYRSLDSLVRARLKAWPQRPPGLPATQADAGSWLRGRPADECGSCQPFLKLPGSRRFRTLPDGLWLHFGGTPDDPYADIFAIEACSSLQNLLDKRSRFAPSTQSMLALCPIDWLLAPVMSGDATPRWVETRLLAEPPSRPLVVPVRDMRVMYGLRPRHYTHFATSQVPHAHEYFVPMDTLTRKDGADDPALRALVARASVQSNFFGL